MMLTICRRAGRLPARSCSFRNLHQVVDAHQVQQGNEAVAQRIFPFNEIAAHLPKAKQKLRFKSIDYRQTVESLSLGPAPLHKKMPSRSGSEGIVSAVPSHTSTTANPAEPARPAIAWSCGFLSMKAYPPPRPLSSGKRPIPRQSNLQRDISPFPKTIPRLSRRDSGAPARAFDFLSPEDKEAQRAKKKHYTMYLTIIVSKKKIHKLAFVRNKIRKKIRAAIRLVVQDGLRPLQGKQDSIEMTGKMGPAHYLLPGHRYTMQTSLEIYRMPLVEILGLVSDGLRRIYEAGKVTLIDEKYMEELEAEQKRMDDEGGSLEVQAVDESNLF